MKVSIVSPVTMRRTQSRKLSRQFAMRRFRARRSSGLMIARRFAAATGDIIFVQDADLEYNPGGEGNLRDC